jgi:hypothetical protein
VLHINSSTYHDIIATVNSDLLLIEQQKQEFTPTAELKEIKLPKILTLSDCIITERRSNLQHKNTLQVKGQ